MGSESVSVKCTTCGKDIEFVEGTDGVRTMKRHLCEQPLPSKAQPLSVPISERVSLDDRPDDKQLKERELRD